MQLSLVVAGPRVDAVRRMRVALRAAQLVRLGVQQRIKGLFHRPAHHLVQVAL